MGSFKSFGKRGFGGGKREFGGGQGSGDKAFMYQATCAECGKPCEVPFKPTGERPVYCKECFASRRSSDSGNHREGKIFGKPQFREERPRFQNTVPAGISTAQLVELNAKLDRIINALAKYESAPPTAPASESPKKETKTSKAKKAVKKATGKKKK